ncbi:MAG: amidohydrolase family protein [Thermodesulfobacteriota bacterium]
MKEEKKGAIDFRVRLRTPELLSAWAPEPAPHFRNYVKLYKMEPRLSFQTPEQTLGEMDEAGIEKAVLCGGSLDDNREIAKMIHRFPERFIGVAGCRPDKDGIMKSCRGLRDALQSMGLKGLSLGPYIMNVYSNDKKLYPLYAICAEIGAIAIIHASLHYNTLTPMDLGDPRFFDEIAVDFPELKIVMSHSGVGFGAPMALAIAQRHENVYLEVSALIPKYVNPMFLHAYNSFLKDKVLFGTDYPLVPFGIVDEWRTVIRPENREQFFCRNAQRLLGI